VIPITSIATIDDLIVNLIRLGYRKSYKEFREGRIYSLTRDEQVEVYKNSFHVWRLPQENIVRVFIHYRTPPIDDVYEIGDVFLTAEIVGEFYPHIKQWYLTESPGGTEREISWEDAEFIDLNKIDQYLNKVVKKWREEDVIF
jgi:hypothetical protein